MPEEPELLAALGRVSIRHGFLDHILKHTIKTLSGLTIHEADSALAYDGSGALRDLVKKLATQKFGKASGVTLRLRAMLADCERLTGERNRLIHNLWAREMDGEPLLLAAGSSVPVPSAGELNQLADEIFALAGTINTSRFEGGFLFDALKQKDGPQEIAELKKD